MTIKIRHPFISLATSLVLLTGVALAGVACDKTTEDTTPPDKPVEVTPEPAPPARVYPEPPAPSAQRPVNFPALQKYELPNKLTVYIVENHEVPIIDVQLIVKAGTVHDDLVAEFAADMLTEGTKKRPKAKIDETIEQIGSSLGTGAGEHNSVVSTRVLSPNLKTALDLVSDVAQNPKFDEAALAKLKDQKKVAVKSEKSDGGQLAQRLTAKLLYPAGHPYAPDFPTDTEIDEVTVASLQAFHDTWYRPGNAYLLLSGDVTKADVEKLVEQTLGKWKPGGEFPAHPLEKFTADDYRKAVPTELAVHIVDRNQISSDIVIANVNGVARNSPEWVKMEAVTKLFGGGMASRLFRDIREERKLTYNIGAYQAPQKVVGAFAMVTQTKEVDQMLTALFDHVDRLRTTDPTDVEFKAAIDNMALSFPLQIETASQIAGKVSTILTYGLPEDYYNTYIDEVRKLTLGDIKTAAANHIHTTPVIVIVGKAAKIKKQLKDVPLLKDAKIYEYDTDLNPK
jgi:zinc protease